MWENPLPSHSISEIIFLIKEIYYLGLQPGILLLMLFRDMDRDFCNSERVDVGSNIRSGLNISDRTGHGSGSGI